MFRELSVKISRSLLGLLYPEGLYCLCCDKIIDSSRPYQLCNECMDGFKWATGRTCTKCGKPLSVSNTRNICYSCAEHTHFFRKGYTCSEYGTHERALLYKLKYNSDTAVAVMAGEAVADMLAYSCDCDYDLIIPVPAHRSRQLSRGYNQAQLIAEEAASKLGITCDSTIVERTAHTDKLRTKTPDERRAILDGVFRVRAGKNAAIRGLKILVVDDIYTTGATMDSVARVLYEAGAESVDIVSFASGADVVK
ncbi:MAG: ComF family protein [Clostridiales bacterium]|nr:ComF family protein [Candidatus Crickella merdequi]